jgi:hypothetical protein
LNSLSQYQWVTCIKHETAKELGGRNSVVGIATGYVLHGPLFGSPFELYSPCHPGRPRGPLTSFKCQFAKEFRYTFPSCSLRLYKYVIE